MEKCDFTNLRKQFPLMEERTYLATHTLGPLPREAFLDIESYTKSLYLGRRVFSIWLKQYEEMFLLIEKLINAPNGSVAITASTTAAQAAIAAAIQPDTKRNRAIVTDLDFSSGRYLWNAQSQRGFEIIEIKASDEMRIEAQDVLNRIDDRVAVVAISLISYINSARIDIQPIIEAAHAVGAIVVLDAYQAVGIVPVDVIALDVDVLVGGMNKWLCGGVGLAFAYVKPSLIERIVPVYPGWFAHVQPAAFTSLFTPANNSRRIQQGTQSFEPIYTSRAGLQLAIDIGVEQIHQRNIELTNYLIDRADRAGISILTPRSPHHRGGTILLKVDRPETVVEDLAQMGIDVDTRSSQGIRVSPHPCNTETECQYLIDNIVQIADRHQAVI
jgi:kynureninase